MKKCLFWLCFPVIAILSVILGILVSVCSGLHDYLHKFEGWAMDYKKNGWVYKGDGMWVQRHD